jgi:hypothetical protein
VAEHAHVLDRQHGVEERCDAEHTEHARRVGRRRVGEDAAPARQARQPPQRLQVVRVAVDMLLEPGQPVRVCRKWPGGTPWWRTRPSSVAP